VISQPSQIYQETALLRGQILEDLQAKIEPRIGQFEPETLRLALTKPSVQMGAQKFVPNGFFFEFIFPDPTAGTVILTVFVPSKERIVFLPVPNWVRQNIWQGDIEGSYYYESEVEPVLSGFRTLLSDEKNAVFFEKSDSDFVKW
jgi:hypothetical protein